MNLEARYVVFKIDDLIGCGEWMLDDLIDHVPQVEGVIIEKDWPEYQPTVDLLMERIESEPRTTK